MLRCLLAADSLTASIADNEGEMPLHIVCRSKGEDRAALARELLVICPRSVAVRNNDGGLPIHIACVNRDPRSEEDCEVIHALLSVFKEGATVADDNGLLPAHLAAENATTDVMEALLAAYPDAVSVNVERHGLPIHLAAVRTDDGSSMVNLLHSRYPKGAMNDDNGWLPLHSASVFASFATLRAVYAIYPKAVEVPNKNGDLPLHLLLDNARRSLNNTTSDDVRTLQFLLKQYPAAVGIYNAAKERPYDICYRRGWNSHIRRLLLRAYPECNPAELRELNYAARREALFLAFSAIPRLQPLFTCAAVSNVFVWKLRELVVCRDLSLFKNIVSFL
jgi:hypothetical protein